MASPVVHKAMPRETPSGTILRSYSDPARPISLSVVLPCYRAPSLARQSVARLANALSGSVPSYEIIVVDDGPGDCESSLANVFPGAGGSIRVITLPVNRGKGAAVAEGMRVATGAARIFTDIDLPYGTTAIMLVESLIRTRGFHMVVGDRTFPQSRYETELSIGRRLASAVFSQVTATLVTGGFFDTQCGLKGFRGDVARELFRLCRVDRFAFDVELLYLALTYGLEIKRVPVMLESNSTSSVRLGRDSMRTLIDVARIKLHQMRGEYDSEMLAGIVGRECDAMSDSLVTRQSTRPILRVEA